MRLLLCYSLNFIALFGIVIVTGEPRAPAYFYVFVMFALSFRDEFDCILLFLVILRAGDAESTLVSRFAGRKAESPIPSQPNSSGLL